MSSTSAFSTNRRKKFFLFAFDIIFAPCAFLDASTAAELSPLAFLNAAISFDLSVTIPSLKMFVHTQIYGQADSFTTNNKKERE